MKVKTNWVPSAFTMANMFCGFFSAVLASNGKFIQAAWLIVAAAVMDTLDGKIARLANASSHFGVEYDSLADVVSFGFAPSFLAYQSVFKDWGTIGLFISAAPLLFGSVRLARFNARLRGFDKSYFEGLPTPAAAITISAFLILNYHFWHHLRWEKVFLFIVIGISILMVSTFRYDTMPAFSLRKGSPERRKVLLVFIGVFSVILFPQELLLPWCVGYALSGPFRFLTMAIKGTEESEFPNESAVSNKKENKNEGNRKSTSKKRYSRPARKSGQ
ncbi:MAG: CDP-diacylglycerol--serine O-phosphatidyltransferase [Calditrichia bacterium]